MTRAVLAVLAAAALAACGTPPEDTARDRGEQIGEALRALAFAATVEEAGAAIDDVVQVRRSLDGEVADDVGRDADAFSLQLERVRDVFASRDAVVTVDGALEELRGAAQDARALAGALRGSGGSVQREFWRGVVDGYEG